MMRTTASTLIYQTRRWHSGKIVGYGSRDDWVEFHLGKHRFFSESIFPQCFSVLKRDDRKSIAFYQFPQVFETYFPLVGVGINGLKVNILGKYRLKILTLSVDETVS